jgi:glycosyltransferase involved in cell wall biosynthesis
MRRAEQLHREKPFDLMHSFWLGPAWVIGNRLAATWHIPHLTTLMGQDVLPSNRYLKLLRPRHAPHLIALSPFHHGIFKQTTGQQVEHIIPWGVDDIATQQINPSERPIDVLGCGSLIPVKQWDKWMEVVAGLVRKYPGLRAELVGEGPQRKALENKIRELNLGAHVVLTGALPRPQVLTKMQAARVLLHTAAFESFGFVIAEAAMSGCRIVSTPVGVAPELGDCAEDVETLEGLVEGALQGAVREQRTPPCRMDEIGEQYLGLWKGRVV